MSNFIKTLFGDYIENLYNESCNDIKCIELKPSKITKWI